MKDVYAGLRGHHLAPRSTAAKVLIQYWPTMIQDVVKILQKYQGCQRMAKPVHVHAAALKSILITWPFARWGIDLLGPFPLAKWVETEHLTSITSQFVQRSKI